MPRRELLVAGLPSPGTAAVLTHHIDDFVAGQQGGGRVVLFEDGLREYFAGRRDVCNWNDAIPYAVLVELWEEAYASLERVSACLEGHPGARLLSQFRHHAADTLWRCLVIEYLLRETREPLLAIVPENSVDGYRALGVVVRRSGSWWRDIALSRLQLARVGGALLRSWRAVYRRAGAAPAGKPSQPGAEILVVVEDGTSRVNRKPAEDIIRALEASGAEVLAVTANTEIYNRFTARNICTAFCGEPAWGISLPRLVTAYQAVRRGYHDVERRLNAAGAVKAFLRLMRARSLRYLVFRETVLARLETAAMTAPPRAILAVNEATPLAVIAGEWAKERGIPDYGYWPVLVGRRPDYRFFPASHHLVYGDQLRDYMVSIGINPDTIQTVGTSTYDDALHYRKEASVRHVREQVLKSWREGDKLVVVATEALPSSMNELAAVMHALYGMSDVHVVIKVHPSDSYKYYCDYVSTQEFGNRVEVVGACDVLALLQAADLLVCILSNLIISAGILGTPTLVCDFGNKRKPLDFVAEGFSTGCFDAAELPAKLGSLLGDAGERQRAVDRMSTRIHRFNGANDGRSAARIARILLDGVSHEMAAPRDEFAVRMTV